jgi:HEAT repeat protein
MRIIGLLVVASAMAFVSSFGQTPPSPSPDEQVLHAAGLSTDGEALFQFFRDRTRPSADFAELLRMAQQLGDPSADKRAAAKAKLMGSGPWAIPALRHVVNDLENPLAAQQARHCLDWLEGKRAAELPSAAARLLASRKPGEAAGMLLTFLPFASDPIVAEGVKSALDGIAVRPGKIDAALLAALADPLPLRRAVAAEVLASSGRPEALPDVRKLLSDTKPQVRVRVALALTQHLEEKAVGTLIDMLLEAPPAERRQAELALHQLAGAWSPTPLLNAEDDLSRKICHEAWSAWWRSVDGAALTAAFRLRTLSEPEAAAAKSLVDQLGSSVFIRRERAVADLVAQGTKVIGLLRDASKSKDPELAQRAEICLKAIAKNEALDRLPLTAPRLLAIRQSADASETLLAFLPFADDHAMSAEIVKTISILVRAEGKADAALAKALSDPMPARRIVAAEILARAGIASHPAVRKLLTDADLQVRLKAALALLHAQDREAVPALIDLVADLPAAQVWEADDVLRLLAGAKAPARPSSEDAAARKSLHAAWQGWWKNHGAAVDLTALKPGSVLSGLILIAELGPRGAAGKGKGGFGGFGQGKAGGDGLNLQGPAAQGGPPAMPPQPAKGGGKKAFPALPANVPAAGTDRLVAVDRNGQVVWQIEDLQHPIDFQILPGDRVLVAEYAGYRVTERDLKGKIVWETKNLGRPPVSVQRLANGNTFIALYHTPANGGGTLLEVDREGKIVATTANPVGAAAGAAGPAGALVRNAIIRAAYKMPDGQVMCLGSNESCVRLDATGKEVKRFAVPLFGGVSAGVSLVPNFAGNIDVTPRGHLVVALSNNTVGEFDRDGKLVWQVKTPGCRATRLANSNTLVALDTGGVVELELSGKTVWQYQPPAGYHAVRARQVPLSFQAGPFSSGK